MAFPKTKRPKRRKRRAPRRTFQPIRSGDTGFAKFFTTKNGRRIYAEDYGYRAWPIRG